MKLSKTQLEALKKLKEGNFEFIPYWFTRDYYLLLDGSRKKFRVAIIHKLIDLGLVKKRKEEKTGNKKRDRHEVAITEKGIRFLEEMK